MSEPIREQLAKSLREILLSDDGPASDAEVFAGGDIPWDYQRTDVHDLIFVQGTIELGQLATEILAALSPVGETEAAKLPLDPEPYVLGNGQRFAKRDIGEMDYVPDFAPEPKYSQNEEDY